MPAILVDASGYIYRAFYAQPPMTRSDGLPTGAVHGFCRMLWSLKKKHVTATHFAVIFDKGKSAKRVALYPDYKAQRKPMDDALLSQLDLVRDATRAFGFPVVEDYGVEADDLLASYAEAFAAIQEPVTIVTQDKDLFQVMREGIDLYCPQKERLLDADDCIERLGVPPYQAVDAQALIGDASDNIPGVKSIGKVYAGQLLKEFGDLDNVLMSIPCVQKKSLRETLARYREQALLSRRLATLDRNVRLPVQLRDLEARDIDAEKLLAFAKSMEFLSFAADVGEFYRLGEMAHA